MTSAAFSEVASIAASKRAENDSVVEKPSSAFMTGSATVLPGILKVTGANDEAGIFKVPSVEPAK
jgi:hypothetical protein